MLSTFDCCHEINPQELGEGVAATAEIYAKRQKLSQESTDYAHDMKIEALRNMPKNEGTKG